MRERIQPILRDRNLLALLGSTTISQFGTGISMVALAFAVLSIGTTSDLGIVLTAREVPIVVFLMLGGMAGDRVSRKWLLIGGDALSAASQVASALLLLTGTASVWSIAILQGCLGLALAFTRPATTGLVPDAIGSEHIQRANALLEMARSAMRIVGPAVGASIVALSSPGWAIAIDAATFAVSAIIRASLRVTPTARASRSSVLGDLRDGWREFSTRSWVWVMVSAFGIFQMTLFPAFLVLGAVVSKKLLGGAGAWGTILAADSAGALVGGLLAMWSAPSRPLLVSALTMLPSAAVLALVGAAQPTWIISLVAFVAGASLTTGTVIWYTTLQQRVPPDAISRISSFDWMGSIALNPLGYAIVGPVASLVGVSTTLYVAAGLNASVAVAAALVPSIHAREPAPTGTASTPATT